MIGIRYISWLLLLLVPPKHCAPIESVFNISVIHVNDFHARFEPTSNSAGICKEGQTCIGGFSRLYKQIESMLQSSPDSILLNAGDNFQGTLWYTVGKWNVTQQFLNKLPFDAVVLGNHEFDDKIEGLIPFMKSLKSPIVVSNIDDTLEPDFQGLYNKSTVIERNGKKIGIIGVLISTVKFRNFRLKLPVYTVTSEEESDMSLEMSKVLNLRRGNQPGNHSTTVNGHGSLKLTTKLKQDIADTGNLTFYPESSSINAEAERLVKEEGVFTNIVLSHSGYDVDQAIAANASEKISLIVGGHTHTFLYTGDNPPGPENVEGPYPTIVQSKNWKRVLIVQASSYCRYLGNITVFLDDSGEVIDYSGAPIFLDGSLPQDEEINKELIPWKELVDAEGGAVVGSSLVTLDMSKCKYAECTFGNLVADAMVYSWTNKAEEGSWTYASIAAVTPDGIRTNIDIGNITYNDLITAVPYKNTFDVVEIKGEHIKELLEYNALPYFDKASDVSLKLMQFSGIHVVFNLTRPKGDRIVSLKIRCQACQIPVYEELDLNKTYRMIITNYLAEGGDGYTILTDNMKNLQVGQLDIDVLVDYINHRSPIFQEEEGRIVIYR